ncbi:hypothetical protein ACFQVC_10080 [Streptomyces monticola]|uniref:Uncharacterized protein n=1 Tax=Streptomyces monticola TaxID=2666263 RepID=A0ABW2JEU8_9ACTN
MRTTTPTLPILLLSGSLVLGVGVSAPQAQAVAPATTAADDAPVPELVVGAPGLGGSEAEPRTYRLDGASTTVTGPKGGPLRIRYPQDSRGEEPPPDHRDLR